MSSFVTILSTSGSGFLSQLPILLHTKYSNKHPYSQLVEYQFKNILRRCSQSKRLESNRQETPPNLFLFQKTCNIRRILPRINPSIMTLSTCQAMKWNKNQYHNSIQPHLLLAYNPTVDLDHQQVAQLSVFPKPLTTAAPKYQTQITCQRSQLLAPESELSHLKQWYKIRQLFACHHHLNRSFRVVRNLPAQTIANVAGVEITTSTQTNCAPRQ